MQNLDLTPPHDLLAKQCDAILDNKLKKHLQLRRGHPADPVVILSWHLLSETEPSHHVHLK